MRSLEQMRRAEEIERLFKKDRAMWQHVVDIGQDEAMTSGDQLVDGEEDRVFLAPFRIDRPMSVRRIVSWWAAVTTSATIALALYRSTTERTIDPDELFLPHQEFELIRAGRSRTTDTTIAMYVEDILPKVHLNPGLHAVGFQGDSPDVAFFYNSTGGSAAGAYSTYHDTVPRTGVFPERVFAVAPIRSCPRIIIRSEQGIRARPLIGET